MFNKTSDKYKKEIDLLSEEFKTEEEELSLNILIRDFNKLSPSERSKILFLSCEEYNNFFLKKLTERMEIPPYCDFNLSYSSYIMSKENGFISSGYNNYQQTGVKESKELQRVPRVIDVIDSKEIIGLSAGYSHVILMLNNRQVAGFGNSQAGQLGLGRKENSKKKKKLFIIYILCQHFFFQKKL